LTSTPNARAAREAFSTFLRAEVLVEGIDSQLGLDLNDKRRQAFGRAVGHHEIA
jgi:hypothetical protein